MWKEMQDKQKEEQLTNNSDEVFTIGPIWHQFMANVPNQQNSSENRIIV